MTVFVTDMGLLIYEDTSGSDSENESNGDMEEKRNITFPHSIFL